MVEYNIAVDSKELADNLRRWEQSMPGFLQTLFDRFGQSIAARSNERAKQVLNVITGRLSTSIMHRADPEKLEVGADTSVKYAAVHEYGFSGSVTVPAHTRTMAFGRTVSPFTVGSFSRRVNIPARPFVRPTIDDFFMGREAESIADGLFESQKRRMGFE